jgi:hypothetical protein
MLNPDLEERDIEKLQFLEHPMGRKEKIALTTTN